MKKDVVYTGLFVKDQEFLLENFSPKHDNVYAHHSTISFRPKTLEGIDLGKEYELKIIARVFDEKGDVLIVENKKSQNKHPHITLSCADGIKPVYSNELIEKKARNDEIQYFAEPVIIKVTEGYFDGENVCTK